MAAKYAVASGPWSSTATWSDTDGGLPGAAVPVTADAVIVSAGVSVLMDVDTSGFAAGISGVTIRGVNSGNPGMLYWKAGTSGYLKMTSGTLISSPAGSAINGRLLANSDGVWGNTSPLPFANKATILLQGVAKIDYSYLDVALYTDHPTNWYVRTYGSSYAFSAANVNPATDRIDLGVTPPVAGTMVMVVPGSGATLPAGLEPDTVYYVRGVVGTTLQLSYRNDDIQLVSITDTGTGTFSLVTGVGSGATALNVLEDVSGDARWTTTARAVLVGFSKYSRDIQRTTVSAIAAGVITVADAVDSAQAPGARLYLSDRNVSIQDTYASSSAIAIGTGSTTQNSAIFDCQIINTASAATTLYGTAIQYGAGVSLRGILDGWSTGMSYVFTSEVSGVILSCGTALSTCHGAVVSGGLMGNSAAIAGSSEYVELTSAGECLGFNYAVYGTTFSARLRGRVGWGPYLISGGFDAEFSGLVEGIMYLVYYNTMASFVNARVRGADYLATWNCRVVVRDSTVLTFGVGNESAGAPFLGESRFPCVTWEDYGGVLGAHRTFSRSGDAIKNDSIVRTGGAASSIETVPNSYCGPNSALGPFEWTETDVPASAQTRTVYVKGEGWTTWPTASQLWLEAEYIDNAGTLHHAVAKSTAVLTDNATWVAFTVAFTPAVSGIVRYRLFLMAYQALSKIYVDNQLS